MIQAKMQGKIYMFGVAEGGCLSLHMRLYATVADSASPETLPPSKGAMRWHVGDRQMPYRIYPQATGTRPGAMLQTPPRHPGSSALLVKQVSGGIYARAELLYTILPAYAQNAHCRPA